MCTVTYVPNHEGFFLSSNRDEKNSRAKAFQPCLYQSDAFKIIYPKDPDGQGSWIAVNDNGTAAVLLNGAFIKHQSQPVYRRSRGLVFLDIITAPKSVSCFSHLDLTDIEPFTIIIANLDLLTECRWDGVQKFIRQLDYKKPYIWSSATLYGVSSVEKRAGWFKDWLQEPGEPDETKVFNFHRSGGDGNLYDGLVINRREEMKTVSITSIVLTNKIMRMNYSDLKTGEKYELQETIH